MAAARHNVVGLGEALWDVLPSGKHLGGAPLNFAYIASLLGERSLIATRIGNDTLGAEIRSQLQRRHLDPSGLQVDDQLPTGTVEVSFADGQPQYEIRQPAAWDALEWSPQWQDIASKSDAICFGTLAQRATKSRQTIEAFVQRAPETCLKVLDINLRRPFYSRQLVESSLRIANILKLNDQELTEIAAMFGVRDADRRAQMTGLLRAFDLKSVFVTRGSQGAMATDGRELVEDPGFRVQVGDTIGAGDAFTAASVHCLLRELSLEKTLVVANQWAAWVASETGGMPELSLELRQKMLTGIS